MGLRCLHTSIFIEAPSLERLPTKAKEDPSPHEMRVSPTGHQPSISWSQRTAIIVVIIIIIIIIIIITINTIIITIITIIIIIISIIVIIIIIIIIIFGSVYCCDELSSVILILSLLVLSLFYLICHIYLILLYFY